MTTEKLFELLTLVDGVKSTRWETVKELVDLIEKGMVSIKSKKWSNDLKNNTPAYYLLDLSKIDTWSTFDTTCIDIKFSNNTAKSNGHPNNQLECKVKIYDGNSFSGERTNLRFEALFWLPTSFIHNIEQKIMWAFETYLEKAYEDHLKAQKQIWIHNMSKEILKQIKL